MSEEMPKYEEKQYCCKVCGKYVSYKNITHVLMCTFCYHAAKGYKNQMVKGKSIFTIDEIKKY